jgi:Putative zinc-finger
MKPECKEYQEKIARSLLGDLTVEERQSFDDHLATCPDCRSEQKSYVRTLHLMKSVDNEPVPRHFFVSPEERNLNPWQLFRLMKPRWQAITTALAGLFLLTSIGWAMTYNRGNIDIAALKKDILKAAEEKNSEAREIFLQEVRAEIARSRADLSQQQKAELAAAVTRMETRITGGLTRTEGRMREDANKLAVNLYTTVAQQRAQDLAFINLRFDSIQASNAHNTRQTDAILDTLLQAAELRLR